MLFRSSWICLSAFLVKRSFRFSAKMNGSVNFTKSGRSLMKMQNNRGPSREPCGTPLVTPRVAGEQLFDRKKLFTSKQLIMKGFEEATTDFN